MLANMVKYKLHELQSIKKTNLIADTQIVTWFYNKNNINEI